MIVILIFRHVDIILDRPTKWSMRIISNCLVDHWHVASLRTSKDCTVGSCIIFKRGLEDVWRDNLMIHAKITIFRILKIAWNKWLSEDRLEGVHNSANPVQFCQTGTFTRSQNVHEPKQKVQRYHAIAPLIAGIQEGDYKFKTVGCFHTWDWRTL